MAKLVIRNRAEPRWQPVIEDKLHLMLGSMLAFIARVEVDFDGPAEGRDGQSTYALSLLIVEGNGQRHVQHNSQPDGNMAIEGAIARARRAVTRQRRARAPGWGQASAY